ncbi:uncharacterized protein LOC125524015 [Triticum urartu]|uniref:uncharacterized protein LOC125524015 n=1 Tax=Triticum urartu TaxID=4572 RepID=UPI0020434F2E|nr:uncharacterized protein LOC125524015 [Triticum urartu]
MRLPLHPFFGTVLNHFGLAPSQLLPNGWRVLAGFVVLSHFAGVEPSLPVFLHFFALCLFPPHRFYSFRGKDNHGLLFARMRNRFARDWKGDFFFLASSAPWPCPVEWGLPFGSSTLDQTLTGKEKDMAKKLLRARRSSPIDLTTYLTLSNDNLAAAKIIGAPSAPPTPREKAATAAAAAACVSAGKVTVKSEPDCEVLPCAPSLGKKRKAADHRAFDGESSASEPSGPPGFPAPCKRPSATGKDGDWKAARLLLQGTVTPSRERELAASKPADVVASSYVSLLQAANEVSFSLGRALELEEKLRAREREADALRAELREAKAELAARGSSREHAHALAERERRGYERGMEDMKRERARALAERDRRGYERGMEEMKRAALRRYPDLDPARLIVPLHPHPPPAAATT